MKDMAKYVYVFLFGLLFVACRQTEDTAEAVETPTLTLYSAQEQVAEAAESIVTIYFSASAYWTVSVPDEVRDWCIPTAVDGAAGEVELQVILAPNEQTDDRNARITISSGTASFSVFIVQKQRNALTVSADRFEVEPAGGVIAVEVKSNVDYAWEMDYGMNAWVTQIDEAEANRSRAITRYATTRTLETEIVYFRVSPNEDVNVRTGSIVFYAPGQTQPDGLPLEETVNIYQREKDVLLLTEPQAGISDDGGWLKVEINSNVDFEIQMPPVEWIQLDVATRAVSSHTVYFKVSRNDVYETREADIVFYQKDNPALADTLHVIQAEKEGWLLGSDVLEVSEDGQVVEVLVKTNVDVELYIPDNYADWLKQVDTRLTTRTLTDSRFYLEVAPNPYYNERTAYIQLIGYGKTNHQQLLTLIQGPQRHLEMEKDTLVVEPEGDELYIRFWSSVDYEVEMTADWLHQSQTRSLDYQGLLVNVDPYTDVNQPIRQAMVIVKDTKSVLADTVLVMQKPLLHASYKVDPAGTLPSLVPEEQKLDIRLLKVSGKLNGTDIHLIREMAGGGDNGRGTSGRLLSLDMSEAEIVGGGDAYYSCWGSGAAIPTPIIYWYTYDHGTHYERPNGWTDIYYTEGIGPKMFCICQLTSIVLPAQLRLIGDEAFYGGKFTTLTLPETVTTIGKKAFAYSQLQDLHVKAEIPPQLDTDALKVEGALTVYVPAKAVDAYKAADGWKELNIQAE